MKKITLFTLSLVLALVLASCGGAYTESPSASPAPAAAPQAANIESYAAGFSADVADEPIADESEMVAESPLSGGGDTFANPSSGGENSDTTAFLASRKVIRNASIELQTMEFDNAVASIEGITASFGGYTESSYVSGRDINSARGYSTRNANYSVRVPSEQLDAFLDSFGGGMFNVIGRSTSSEDITDRYFDNKARMDSLKLQEQRLLGMLEGATELEYMIQLEQELSRVRYEIETLTAQLSRMDNYVSLSTVNISLYEVVKYEQIDEAPVTFGERVSQAFTSSWRAFADFCQNFAIETVSALPFLLLLAFIAAVVLLIVKVAVKRRKSRKTQSNPAAPGVQLPYTPPPESSAEEQKDK